MTNSLSFTILLEIFYIFDSNFKDIEDTINSSQIDLCLIKENLKLVINET